MNNFLDDLPFDVKISITEYLTLEDAMKMNIVSKSINDFLHFNDALCGTYNCTGSIYTKEEIIIFIKNTFKKANIKLIEDRVLIIDGVKCIKDDITYIEY